MTKILVFPCGSEIAVEICNCLYQQKNIKLYGASSVDGYGKFFFENYIGNVPFVNDPKFLLSIKNIVYKNKIDFIYPAMDVAINVLKNAEEKLGCPVLSSPKETINIIAKKSTTYNHLRNAIRVPLQYTDILEYPAFSKPDIGSSGKNTMFVDSKVSYEYSKEKYPDNIYLEYLPGAEFTVDCFNNKNGELIFLSSRQRTRIVNGISVEMKLVEDEKIKLIANTICKNLVLTGPWFFQLKKDANGDYCLLEIASRFGGSSVFNRLRGVNFAYLNVLQQFGEVEVRPNNYEIEISRGFNIKTINKLNYDTVYIDFDDTIIINGKVNTKAIEFLYRCVNRGKKIILLTKHKYDIIKSMQRHKIDVNLFDEILQLDTTKHKVDYIKCLTSVFIDDSFHERISVNSKLNIPCISVENIEFL